ncbi:hypothetical protein AAC387_Pa06g0757 [Persea americana]
MHPHVPLLAFYLLPLPTLTKLSRLSSVFPESRFNYQVALFGTSLLRPSSINSQSQLRLSLLPFFSPWLLLLRRQFLVSASSNDLFFLSIFKILSTF